MSSIEVADVRGRNKDIQSRKEGGQHWLSFAVLQLVLPERLAISCSLAPCMCLFWLESTALCVRCSTISPGYCSLIADPLQGHSASPLNRMLHFSFIKNPSWGIFCRRPYNERHNILIKLHQLCIFSHPLLKSGALSKTSKDTDQNDT